MSTPDVDRSEDEEDEVPGHIVAELEERFEEIKNGDVDAVSFEEHNESRED